MVGRWLARKIVTQPGDGPVLEYVYSSSASPWIRDTDGSTANPASTVQSGVALRTPTANRAERM